MLFFSIVGLVNLLKYQLIIKPICYICTYMGNVHILQSSFTLIKVHTLLMPILTLQEAITIMNSSTIFLLIIDMIIILCVVIVVYKNIEFVWVQGKL